MGTNVNLFTSSMRGLTMKKLFCLGLIAGLFLVSSAAFAEDPIDKELDYFWGKKRDIEVIQKRQFLREGRHEFTLMGGTIPNDDFFVYYPLGIRYNWFFLEDWSVEVAGAWLFRSGSDLESFLENTSVINVKVYLPERLWWYAAVDGQWTPFHGKLALLTSKLTHFDIYINFGAGVMAVLNKESGTEKKEYQPMGNLGAGMQFYLLDWLALRLDYRHYFYKSNAYNGLSWPAEVTLGVAFFTKGAK